MKSTPMDPCFFYKRDSNKLVGVQVTQVDDTCGGGSDDFSSLETEKAQSFKSKPKNTELPMKFNGIWIESNGNKGYKIHQNDYCLQIQELEFENSKSSEALTKAFESTRGKVS